MEEKRENSAVSFTGALELSQMGVACVPKRYVLPPLQRPNCSFGMHSSTVLPEIDLSCLHDPIHRSGIIKEVGLACKELGVFQVINHGINLSIISDAMDAAAEFFDLPHEEKISLASADVHEHEEIEEGSQVMAINCYPACPEPDLVLGMPPHSDYGYLTILAQNHPGLQIMDHDKRWHQVPFIEGALIIQLGDQMEVISNGRYKSPVHQATVNSKRTRISIASLHSLAFDRKVRPAPELVDEQHLLSNSALYK